MPQASTAGLVFMTSRALLFVCFCGVVNKWNNKGMLLGVFVFVVGLGFVDCS